MKVFPIISIWIMGVLCVTMLVLVVMNRKKIARINTINRMVMICLVFLINLRFMTPTGEAYMASVNLDVLFVIDTTISMSAEDYDGNTPRLDAVKADVEYMIGQLAGARFSVISFHDIVRTNIPYIRDTNLAIETIKALRVRDFRYARGSSLNIVIDEVVQSFERVPSEDENICVMFFISDGEITNGDRLHSFAAIEPYLDGGAVLGYGTPAGGRMLDQAATDLAGEPVYVYDYDTGQDGISVIDEHNLQIVADDVGIEYILMSKQSNVDAVLSDVLSRVTEEKRAALRYTYEDTYYWLVGPLCLLLFWELIRFRRRCVL